MKLVDFIMTKLFQMAEHVCSMCSSLEGEPAATQSPSVTPTIRFSEEDKAALAQPKVKMVEGDLFN